MIRLELTEQEALTLVEVLESALSDLAAEMVATENREMRAALKERKTFIRGILARLGSGGEERLRGNLMRKAAGNSHESSFEPWDSVPGYEPITFFRKDDARLAGNLWGLKE